MDMDLLPILEWPIEDCTDEEDFPPLVFKRTVRPSSAAKPTSHGVSSSAASTHAFKAGVTGCSPRRAGLRPKRKYKTGMETEETTARQAQLQMHQFASTVTELCTGFETSKKKNEELGKQVDDLKGQIQKWKDQKASWDEKKIELERERNEAREASRCLCTGFETSKKKNEELGKQVDDLKGQIQKWKDQKASWDEKKIELERERNEAREKLVLAVVEKRNIEEKLEKAAKQVDDAKASAKKAIYEAVALTTRCYKNCLGNFVASLANGEGDSLKDYAKELVKEMLCGDRALADDTALEEAP